MRSTIRVTGVLAGFVLALTWAFPALAVPSGRQSLRPGESFEQRYPPIGGMNPVYMGSLKECRASDACHVIELAFEPGKGPHAGELRLVWDELFDDANDLDFYMWDGAGADVDHAATQANPEVMGIADLPAGTYYLGVVNFLGANDGYTLTGSLRAQQVPAPVQKAGPALKSSLFETSNPVPAPLAPVGAPQPVILEPGELVRVPGADGPPGGLSLHGIPASAQAPAGEGIPFVTIVGSAIVAAFATGGALALALRIRADMRVN